MSSIVIMLRRLELARRDVSKLLLQRRPSLVVLSAGKRHFWLGRLSKSKAQPCSTKTTKECWPEDVYALYNLLSLPEEIICVVICHLSVKDVLALAQVCVASPVICVH